MIFLEPFTEPKYVIGVDTSEEDNKAYCLMLEISGVKILLLAKSSIDVEDFDAEVNNLIKYFNATLIEYE